MLIINDRCLSSGAKINRLVWRGTNWKFHQWRRLRYSGPLDWPGKGYRRCLGLWWSLLTNSSLSARSCRGKFLEWRSTARGRYYVYSSEDITFKSSSCSPIGWPEPYRTCSLAPPGIWPMWYFPVCLLEIRRAPRSVIHVKSRRACRSRSIRDVGGDFEQSRCRHLWLGCTRWWDPGSRRQHHPILHFAEGANFSWRLKRSGAAQRDRSTPVEDPRCVSNQSSQQRRIS